MAGTGSSTPPKTPLQQQIDAARAREEHVRVLREQHAGVIMAEMMGCIFDSVTGHYRPDAQALLRQTDAMADIAVGAADALARKLVGLRL